ncbi:MAG: hypothetical protein QOJ35_2822, partial [Solirubrobacteraceae bacterium]|nr:hypothetical protein [Solirubrobacteraceae bacterium]
GLPISGDLGYFSSDEQQVCLRLADGARFGRRKYLRPPPGTDSYGRGGLRSLTFGDGDPSLRCDRYRDRDGLVPRSMPREAVPTDRFSSRAGG